MSRLQVQPLSLVSFLVVSLAKAHALGAASPVAGKWSVVAKSPDGGRDYPSSLEISEEGGQLKGKSTSALGVTELQSVRLDGEQFSFEIVLTIDDNKVAFRIGAALRDGNRLEGRWKTRDADFSGEWTARRVEAAPRPEAAPAPKPAAVAAPRTFTGTWYAVTTIPDGSRRDFRLELAEENGRLAGKFVLREMKVDLRDVTAKDGVLRLRFPFRTAEVEALVTMEAQLTAEGTLKGKWSAEGGESGEFTAGKPVDL